MSALFFVLLIIVVMIAMSSSASFSRDRVSAGAIPHSSRSNSSQSEDSSVSCSAPPSLEANSSSERALDASLAWAATDVPERSSCLPRTRTSSRCLGSLTNSRITWAAKPLVRPRNSSVNHPFISDFCFLFSTFCFQQLTTDCNFPVSGLKFQLFSLVLLGFIILPSIILQGFF